MTTDEIKRAKEICKEYPNMSATEVECLFPKAIARIEKLEAVLKDIADDNVHTVDSLGICRISECENGQCLRNVAKEALEL